MKLNLPLKHSLISLALIGLIGCTTTSQADYVSLAEQSTSKTQQSLLSELIQQTSEEQALNQHASNEQELDTENLQLTDLVNAPGSISISSALCRTVQAFNKVSQHSKLPMHSKV